MRRKIKINKCCTLCESMFVKFEEKMHEQQTAENIPKKINNPKCAEICGFCVNLTDDGTAHFKQI